MKFEHGFSFFSFLFCLFESLIIHIFFYYLISFFFDYYSNFILSHIERNDD